MAEATVGKWGDNLALPLPSEIVRAARLRHGERLEVEMAAEMIIVRRVEPEATLDHLFRGKTAEEWRAHYADAL